MGIAELSRARHRAARLGHRLAIELAAHRRGAGLVGDGDERARARGARGGIVRIERQRLPEQRQRPPVAVVVELRIVLVLAAQVGVERSGIAGAAAAPVRLGPGSGKCGRQRGGDRVGDVLLEAQDVVDRALVAARPLAEPGPPVDEIDRDAHAGAEHPDIAG